MRKLHLVTITLSSVFLLSIGAAQAAPTLTQSAAVSAHNRKEVVVRFGVGGSAPTHDENDSLDGMGLRIGAAIGYQLPLTARLSVTPQAWLGYMSWSGDNNLSSSMFVLGAGAQIDYFLLEKLSLWGGGALGGGSVGVEIGGASESKGGFALALEAGSTYFLHPNFGVGAFFGVTNVFGGKDDQTNTDFSATSIDFGLRLRGSYSL